MKKNRVAILSLNYIPSTGGLVTYIKSICKSLILESNDVTVFCAFELLEGQKEQEVIDGVNVVRVPVFDKNYINKLFGPFRMRNKFVKFFKEQINLNDFDFIVARHVYLAGALVKLNNETILNKSCFLAPLIAPRLIKIDAKSEGLVKKVYSHLLIPQLYIIERAVVKSKIAIKVLSDSKSKEFAEYYNIAAPKVCPPGIDLERFRPVGRTIKEGLNASTRPEFVILSVCRLVEEKNLSLVIESLPGIIKLLGQSRVRYLVAGDGPLMSSLKSLAIKIGVDKNIEFLGEIQEIETVYQKANVFILPSIYEGFGHVYLEANSSGVPCFGLKNGVDGSITACDEIIKEGVNGFLINGNTPEALVRSVELFLKADRTPSDWSDSCRARVELNYSWSAHIKLLQADL